MRTRTKVVGGVIGAVLLLFVLMFILVDLRHMSTDSPTDAASPEEDVAAAASPEADVESHVAQPVLVPNYHSSIDQILKQMEFGNIAFNVPSTMNLYDTAIIHLVLGLEASIDDLKRMIAVAEEKEGMRIRVFNSMEARLSGPNFSVTAITPEIQAVPRSDTVEWKWEVKPRSDGRHNLHLTLSVLLEVEGVHTPRTIRTFQKVIEVEVEWGQQVSSFFDKNWQWLWAAVLIPIVGWLWKKKGSKSEVNHSE